MQAKDLEKALDAFSRAVQIDPENGEAWNNIACLYAHPFIFIPSLLCCSGDGFRCPVSVFHFIHLIVALRFPPFALLMFLYFN
jgi:tetratricopeptide (TPR) repeat protein